MYKVEEYTKNDDICFKYILSPNEKKSMSNIIHQVLNNYKSPTQTIPFVNSCISQIQTIYDNLNSFFIDNPGNYFLRLSSCSPKDAYYQLYCETSEIADDDEIVTVDDIKRDIAVLKVSDAQQTILVLCHSERIYYDLEFDETEIAIILMPWKDNILHDTETRCFIKNKKLIAFSQYYTDLPTGYTSFLHEIDFPKKYYNCIVQFINRLLTENKIPYENSVVDICYSRDSSLNLQTDNLIFIEINPFNIGTDAALFDWNYLLNLDESLVTNPLFKFKIDNEIKEITYFD